MKILSVFAGTLLAATSASLLLLFDAGVWQDSNPVIEVVEVIAIWLLVVFGIVVAVLNCIKGEVKMVCTKCHKAEAEWDELCQKCWEAHWFEEWWRLNVWQNTEKTPEE